MEQERNNINTNAYYTLCAKLHELSTDNSLHWRHVDLAQSLLSMMLQKPLQQLLLLKRLELHQLNLVLNSRKY
jgi:hypothetical protein